MADFCKQCSINMFGEDFKELARISEPGQFADVICEGCGWTTVNHNGECVSSTCLEKHLTCPVVEAYEARQKSKENS